MLEEKVLIKFLSRFSSFQIRLQIRSEFDFAEVYAFRMFLLQ